MAHWPASCFICDPPEGALEFQCSLPLPALILPPHGPKNKAALMLRKPSHPLCVPLAPGSRGQSGGRVAGHVQSYADSCGSLGGMSLLSGRQNPRKASSSSLSPSFSPVPPSFSPSSPGGGPQYLRCCSRSMRCRLRSSRSWNMALRRARSTHPCERWLGCRPSLGHLPPRGPQAAAMTSPAHRAGASGAAASVPELELTGSGGESLAAGEAGAASQCSWGVGPELSAAGMGAVR
jgi:hypothetical protein